MPGSESSKTNIDTSASIPTDNPSPLHYSTIHFESRTANRPEGDGLIFKPTSPSCQYSTVKYYQVQPTCHSTTPMEIPLYSLIKPHQTDDDDDDD